MHELAVRNQEGTISPSEKEELFAFADAGTVLAILQSKARRTLNIKLKNIHHFLRRSWTRRSGGSSGKGPGDAANTAGYTSSLIALFRDRPHHFQAARGAHHCGKPRPKLFLLQ